MIHIFYYYDLEYHNNNKLYPYNINNLELEYPNITYNLHKQIKQIKLINQYLYYMNIHFTNI